MAAKQNKRSIAAKKGWDTRRENARLAAEEKERRSKAAEKAWAKRKRKARELEREISGGFLGREILPSEANPRIRKPKPKPKAEKKPKPKSKPKPKKKRKPTKSEKFKKILREAGLDDEEIDSLEKRRAISEQQLEEFPETLGWVPMFPNRVKRDGTLALNDVSSVSVDGVMVPLRLAPNYILNPILELIENALNSVMPISEMKRLAEQLEMQVQELYALYSSG